MQVPLFWHGASVTHLSIIFSQNSPLKPSGQVQYTLPFSAVRQTPSFLHVPGLQLSKTASHLAPVKPLAHVHRNPVGVLVHVPPLRHAMPIKKLNFWFRFNPKIPRWTMYLKNFWPEKFLWKIKKKNSDLLIVKFRR